MSERMKLGDSGDEHEVGNAACESCWSSYPKPCDNGVCTGLIHASFGDDNSDADSDGDYWLFTRCDVCGEME